MSVLNKITESAIYKKVLEKIDYVTSKDFFVHTKDKFKAATSNEEATFQKSAGAKISEAVFNVLDKLSKKFTKKFDKAKMAKPIRVLAKIMNVVLRILAIGLTLAFGALIVYCIAKLFVPVIVAVATSFAVAIIVKIVMKIIDIALGTSKKKKKTEEFKTAEAAV